MNDVKQRIGSMTPLLSFEVQDLIKKAWNEDQALWDWTALSLSSECVAFIRSKSQGVFCGEAILSAWNYFPGLMNVEIQSSVSDGQWIEVNQIIATLRGKASDLFRIERITLNLIGYLSGISTYAALLVSERPKESQTRICTTRKTLPGYRNLAIYAAQCGGAHPHRLSLGAGILIKENHILAAGSLSTAVSLARSVSPHGLKVECEVETLKELECAIDANVDGVLLDNFTEKKLKEALLVLDRYKSIFVEVSGGISLSSIQNYFHPNINAISVGSVTHSVKNHDFSMRVQS
ncbi:MAG: nicotinate-nucleotide diphosphorylase (carboxylating) [Bdellovibrionaceae bacterium]|nr:nicotinate-nucleotide diphosphorylase (carboxylating) [Pseudobdellovibrionaceae bacterium]|tara:strand:+ start:1397 stop:2272 length:876 start_codon:yes stop_codon:yes gene_type:complete